MLINLKELNSRKIDIEGKNSNVYFLDDEKLAIRFKRCSNEEKRRLIKRYEYAGEIKGLDNVTLPIDTLKTENGFCGYIGKIIPGTKEGKISDFPSYLNAHQDTVTLDKITSYMLKVIKLAKQCHEHDIIIPDMSSNGNVRWNPETNEVYFCDYQGMQVKDVITDYISDFIIPDPVLNQEKYYKVGMYNKNIDIYTLAIRYFYYFSKINIPKAMITPSYNIDYFLKMAGISDTSFADCMRILYDPYKDNEDIEDAVIELNNNYKLTPFISGLPRPLQKK